jgi:hypothetical protein
MRCKDCMYYIKAIQEDRTDAMVCMFDYKKRWLIDGCENGQAKKRKEIESIVLNSLILNKKAL